MAATLTVRVTTTTSPGSLGPAQTGIDLESADNSLNTLANRAANPITVPAGLTSAFSFEKWLLLRVDVAPANAVTNFKAWSAQSSPSTGVSLFGKGAIVSYTTPVSTASGATAILPTTQGAAITWDSASYSSIAQVTKFLVLQLVVLSTAAPGNVPQMTLSYAYDET
jgi:hypothetical protein